MLTSQSLRYPVYDFSSPIRCPGILFAPFGNGADPDCERSSITAIVPPERGRSWTLVNNPRTRQVLRAGEIRLSSHWLKKRPCLLMHAQRPASAAGDSRHRAPNWHCAKRLASVGCMHLLAAVPIVRLLWPQPVSSQCDRGEPDGGQERRERDQPHRRVAPYCNQNRQRHCNA